MQAVLLAAGSSSRFYPYNSHHKSLTSVLGEPLIVHTIRAVKRAGITDVVILTGPKNDFVGILGNGKKYGVKISYATLHEPTGAGDGLLACNKFIKSDFFFVHPYQFEFDTLKVDLDEKRGTNQNVILLAKETYSLENYGGLKVEADKVLGIVEKPKSKRGLANLRIIGVYFLNQEFMKVLKNTPKEHYSFERALDTFAKQGKVRVATTSSQTVTLKYPWDLLEVKNRLLSKTKRKVSSNSSVAKSAQIIGDVVIEDGAHIMENAIVKGPAYIGKNVYVGTNALVRDGSSIEEGAKIGGYMEVKNSLIGKNTTTHSGFIGDSVIGSSCKVGALFGTANVRLDRGHVKVKVKDKSIDTGYKAFGTVMGDSVVIGERVSTMPGVVIGNNVKIGPSTTVMKNIDSDSLFYTKFHEIVEKKEKPATSKT